MFRSSFALLLLIPLAVSACCCKSVKPDDKTGLATQPFRGPTLSMVEVVEQVNRNNRALPSVWSSHYFELNLIDPQTKKTTFVNGNGALLYRRPDHFRLTCNKEFAGSFMEVGSTDAYYWLKIAPPGEPDTLYFGERKHIGKPCVQAIPVQPDLIAEVLGVNEIPTDFLKPPSPVMRFNPDADCYMFVWVDQAGGAGGGIGSGGAGRLVAQKEIWYDRQTFLPRQVMLFDANGRVLLRALLDGHQPTGEGSGKVATLYRLLFPDSGSTMQIRIEQLAASKSNVPTKRGIAFPGANPQDAGVQRVIKLDKDCAD